MKKEIILGAIFGMMFLVLLCGGFVNAWTSLMDEYSSLPDLESKQTFIETNLPTADKGNLDSTSDYEFLLVEQEKISGELCLERLEVVKKELCEKDNSYSWC